MFNPKASFICVEKITTAIPLVKPTIRGCGKNFNSEPNLSQPIKTKMIPDKIVDIINPSYPNFCSIPYKIII